MARKMDCGELKCINPTESFWYLYYIKNALLDDKRFFARFCARFLLPYSQFKEFVEDCRNRALFKRWKGSDEIRHPSGLHVLGSLKFLRRGLTFDDIEESTAVSQEVNGNFFHGFLDFGSKTLYDQYVIFLSNYEEAKRHMREFVMACLL
jgi:hypothetical protein